MIAERRDFRLARGVRPSRYALRFELDLERWTSSAREQITLHLDRPSSEITLHALDLDIQSATIEGGPAFERVAYDEEAQTATLHFDGPVGAGESTLQIAWVGEIRDGLRGLYRSTRPGERYAATQFEAADARRAFPCFDEPEFKARFALELIHDASLVAISNARVEHAEVLPDGRKLTRFAEMPVISTYLVAFTVGPYEGGEEAFTTTGVPVRVWLPPGLADKSLHARTAHVRSLAWLEDYTAIPYPYGKVDAIGIPDFEAGAMENPGAITYRTRLLAADEETASTGTMKSVFSVVAHELTHMWWGDLVTMAWWDDLWLNESFASFVGEKATDALNPEWGYIRDVVAQSTPAFNLDQLASTHPISMEVRNAHQASERFDAVTYLKGMAVLRMIESFISADAFQEGVRIYLRRHAEGNATADDFWRALDEASGRDVTAIANAWIHEFGHPVIHAKVLNAESPDYLSSGEDGGIEIDLRQERFFADPEVKPTDQRWLVPVVVKYGTADGIREQRLLMDTDRVSIRLPGAQWYYPNAGGRGFYRYNLDERSIALLAENLSALAPEERLMLVENQWTLTRARRAKLAPFFALLGGLRGERDRAVLGAITEGLYWLDTHAIGEGNTESFRRFVASFFSPLLDTLGWDARPGESADDRETRARVLAILGRVARVPAVLAEARRRIEAHLESRAHLDPDVASALAGVAAVDGDDALYERYLKRMKDSETTDAQEEARFRGALTAFERPELARRTVDACFGEVIRVQDRGLMLSSLLGTRHARGLAWRAVRDRWDTDIAPLDPGLKHRIISGLSQLTSADLADEARVFLETMAAPDCAEVTAQALERLRLAREAASRLGSELGDALSRVA
ncbi:MAG: alanine aminopeptidase [Chloroflexi bacterium]|nr:alanine aminopeptidase [Chloroflexota bacterium]